MRTNEADVIQVMVRFALEAKQISDPYIATIIKIACTAEIRMSMHEMWAFFTRRGVRALRWAVELGYLPTMKTRGSAGSRTLMYELIKDGADYTMCMAPSDMMDDDQAREFFGAIHTSPDAYIRPHNSMTLVDTFKLTEAHEFTQVMDSAICKLAMADVDVSLIDITEIYVSPDLEVHFMDGYGLRMNVPVTQIAKLKIYDAIVAQLTTICASERTNIVVPSYTRYVAGDTISIK